MEHGHEGHGHMADGSIMSPPMMGGGHMREKWTHMTFYQGKNSEILFKGWPGRNDGGMYALALIVVFILAILVEWANSWDFNRSGLSRRINALVQTAIHAIQYGLASLHMLAVMSFNVGVLLVAMGGRALGFFLFNRAFRRGKKNPDSAKPKPSEYE